MSVGFPEVEGAGKRDGMRRSLFSRGRSDERLNLRRGAEEGWARSGSVAAGIAGWRPQLTIDAMQSLALDSEEEEVECDTLQR